ncbi:MAG: P-II family nitrogen regulator [Bacteroides sp.]|nr:P-II family nitrogen regulator [Eubacterium sp.]MCM1418684.1 P-II family nitrogen regulator [Roseburia sp.]MCM1461988.1 P-II family nitrogen regulator [Bacteroides sp.]
MLLIKAIVRPEKSGDVIEALFSAGFPALTRMDVSGCGKQRGIRVGSILYNELPKDLFYIACNDEDKDTIVSTIIRAARTGEEGEHGDGRIFISALEDAYTISTGERGL